jgi:hypothetical protein
MGGGGTQLSAEKSKKRARSRFRSKGISSKDGLEPSKVFYRII